MQVSVDPTEPPSKKYGICIGNISGLPSCSRRQTYGWTSACLGTNFTTLVLQHGTREGPVWYKPHLGGGFGTAAGDSLQTSGLCHVSQTSPPPPISSIR